MTISKKSMVLWFLFLIQTIVFCQDFRLVARGMLKEIFDRDFSKIPEEGEVHVWKILENLKKFTPENYSDGFIEFGSNETFLILAKKRVGVLIVYYWSGKDTTPENKQVLAKYAMIFHDLLSKSYKYFFPKINLSREYESIETESFLHTIQHLKKMDEHDEEGRDECYRDDHLPLNGPNLYIIKGDENTSITKKVPIDYQCVQSDSCILFETGRSLKKYYPTAIYCGKEAGGKARSRAQKLAQIIIKAISPEDGDNIEVKFIPNEGNEFEEFVQFLKEWKNNRPSDVDNSEDFLKDFNTFIRMRDEATWVFELSVHNFVEEMKNIDKPTFTHEFSLEKSYIFDSESVAGLTFLFGYSAETDVKCSAIVLAEGYLQHRMETTGRVIPMRIMSTLDFDFHFEFLINFENMPSNLEDEPLSEI